MTKFMVDVTVTTTTSYEVEAETAEEARQRYPESGLPVNSEASSPVVQVDLA